MYVSLSRLKNSGAVRAGLKAEKMPGHWVLARMGKRVLRPGGMVDEPGRS